MAQMGFFFDMGTCTGCKTCQIACKDKHDLPPGILFRRVVCYEGGKFPHPWVYYLSLACNHCAAPRCVASCPSGALYKEASVGAVLIDHSKCLGCRKCQRACPYGAIQVNEATGKATKCDMCLDLIAEGEQPACVSSCVMRALHFGMLNELASKYGGTSDAANLPESGITRPSFLLALDSNAIQRGKSANGESE